MNQLKRHLFQIETDRLILNCNKPREKEPVSLGGVELPPGQLIIKNRRKNISFGRKTWRASVPEEVANDPKQIVGPRFYEQTDYKLYACAKSDAHVTILHRDPIISRDLSEEDGGRIVHGYINFGSQAGMSEFTVLVDGEPEFDFEVEIFPSKLDYASDYETLLAEVQDILTGLALEYLRSTFKLGRGLRVPQPSHLEWLALLRHIADELETAIKQIAERPFRRLTREAVSTYAERIKRVDSSLRSTIRRGSGSGPLIEFEEGIKVRKRLIERRARSTLDTPEHRWLAAQLNNIRRRIGWLQAEEAACPKSERRDQTLCELNELETMIVRLSRLEPIASATEAPPTGFASLQLLGTPGYQEAYRCCLILSLGLRIEGDPIRLSVKDLNLLYEYWCYLALLRLISEETGQPISPKDIFSIRQYGLRILLQKGREHAVNFDTSVGRMITITYNPCFQDGSILIPQQPDMLITFQDPHWPTLHLLLDAKYRVDGSQEYFKKYGSPGPPEDAINVLHRYRDAILEYDGKNLSQEQPKHSVVQGVAAFPYRVQSGDDFHRSKLWTSLDRLGIGAIPLLPYSTDYLREWLRSALNRGGWSLADRAIDHRARQSASDWRIASSEAVLVGVLREGNAKQHLGWIKDTHCYYMPLLNTQRRQYVTKWVAIYSPLALREPGAVTHYAAVESIEIKRRDEIRTPWLARRKGKDLQVLYRISSIRELHVPIENRGSNDHGHRFSTHRWTSRLALHRAKILEELFMETEPEWRFYEDLQAFKINFHLEPGKVNLKNPDDPAGRVWFVTDNGTRVRYAGASGFLIRPLVGEERYLTNFQEIIESLSER